MRRFRVAILFFVVAVVASHAAESNLTLVVDGVIYSNVTFRAATPSAVSIIHKTGSATIPLEKLPPDLQKRFGYDPKKAADYRAAEQRAEATRQEALQQQRADDAANQEQLAQQEAENQRQIAESAAERDAAKRAADAAAKKAEEDFNARLGAAVVLSFNCASQFELLSDGKYAANLWYSDVHGAQQLYFVTFPQAGLNFLKNAACPVAVVNVNRWTVYARPYTTTLQTVYDGDVHGEPRTVTAYWLVGVRSVLQGSGSYPAW